MGRPAVFGAADASERASEMFLRTGAFFSSILSEFLKNLVALQPRAEMELLPYHKFGFGKYEALGIDLPDAAFGTPTKEKMEHLKGILREIGISLADFK